MYVRFVRTKIYIPYYNNIITNISINALLLFITVVVHVKR